MLHKVLLVDAAGLVHVGVQERTYRHAARKVVTSWDRSWCGRFGAVQVYDYSWARIVTCLWCCQPVSPWEPPWQA